MHIWQKRMLEKPRHRVHEKLTIPFVNHDPHQFVLSQLSFRCVECKTVMVIYKLFTVHLYHFKDGMLRNASPLKTLCIMNGFNHLPQHSSKSWGGLHQKWPVVTSNHSSNSLGEYLKESPQLHPSSNTHFIGCTEARSVHPNYSLQMMPIKQSQVKVPLPMGLPRAS